MQTIADIRQLPNFINKTATALARTAQMHHDPQSANYHTKNVRFSAKDDFPRLEWLGCFT